MFGIQVGQSLDIVNSDETHNIHALPMANREFNRGQALRGMKYDDVRGARVMLPFKCDVHKWMNAWVGVLEHPFYSVSGKAGAFALAGIPPGTCTIERLAREARRADAADHDRPQGIEKDLVRLQGVMLHLFALLVGNDHWPPDLRGRPRHEHRVGSVGPRLAEHLRLLHVLLPARKDGGRDPHTSTRIA